VRNETKSTSLAVYLLDVMMMLNRTVARQLSIFNARDTLRHNQPHARFSESSPSRTHSDCCQSTALVMTQLPILHWNDVYRVRPQKVSPTSSETIDVTQFAGLLDDIRAQWPLRDDGKRDGLSLFSGDVFAPSVDSSVTRGSHMVRLYSPSSN